MNQHEEILNLSYHYRRMSLIALNKAESVEAAANILGIGTSTLYKWIEQFNINYCSNKNKYIIKN